MQVTVEVNQFASRREVEHSPQEQRVRSCVEYSSSRNIVGATQSPQSPHISKQQGACLAAHFPHREWRQAFRFTTASAPLKSAETPTVRFCEGSNSLLPDFKSSAMLNNQLRSFRRPATALRLDWASFDTVSSPERTPTMRCPHIGQRPIRIYFRPGRSFYCESQ